MTALGQVLATCEGLTRWCLLHAHRGSSAYGVEPRPGSDLDTIAFRAKPTEHSSGLSAFGARGTCVEVVPTALGSR